VSDVFISYASEDRQRAAPIAKALEAEGWSVWWDRNIPAGKRFAEVIEEEIGKARCMVVLWSAVSVTRDWVVEEAEDGKKRGILVPVFIEPVQPPRGFRRIEAADLSGWRADRSDTAFRTLCQNIASMMGTSTVPASEWWNLLDVGVPASKAVTDAPRTERVEEIQNLEGAAAGRQLPFKAAVPESWWSLRRRLIAIGLAAAAVIGAAVYAGRSAGTAGGSARQPVVTVPEAIKPLTGGNPKSSQPLPPGLQKKEPPTPVSAAKGTRATVPTRENPKDGLPYVYIAPGKFMMGCSPDDSECFDDEKPSHEVSITRGFWMGQTPVTEAAYRQVIGPYPSFFKLSRVPEKVDWNQAKAYCEAVGMRLPTEAEWEYAARADSTAARYGDLDKIAWYASNSGGKTHEVGQKQANGFGLYDMLGNMWEWVADWYGEKYYEQKADIDPIGPERGTDRVLRGGSWGNNPRGVRSSYRGGDVPSVRYNYGGFRCAGELRQASYH
jgi:formylglycine-generating enzyme required for sulfatase activity